MAARRTCRRSPKTSRWKTRTFGAAVIGSIVWVSSPDCPDFYDAELRAQHEHLRAAYGISPGNEVLDIGCGARDDDS